MTLSPTIAITGFSSSNSRSLTADSKWGAFLSLTLAFSDSHSEDAFFVHANPLLFLLVAYSSFDTKRLPNVETHYPYPIETFSGQPTCQGVQIVVVSSYTNSFTILNRKGGDGKMAGFKSALTFERMKKGYTQRALSKLAGVNNTTLSSIENRKLVASPRHRSAILEVIGGAEADFFDEATGLAR